MIRNVKLDGDIRDADFLPVPQQISDGCNGIRETWSPREEQRRREWSIARPVEIRPVPMVETPGKVG